MSDDIILLSSDDEFESPPPKKPKPHANALHILKNLKEITTREVTETVGKSRTSVIKKTCESALTIIIDGYDAGIKNEKEYKENGNNVVNLCDESFEDAPSEQTNNASSEFLIVGSDSENEGDSTALPSPIANPIKSPPPADTGAPKPDVAASEPDILNRPSTSTASEAHKLLDEFLETCTRSLKSSRFESRLLPKFPKMKKNFDKCASVHEERNFKKMLQEHISMARISAADAVVSFQRIYSYLMDHINGESVEVAEGDLYKIKELEKTCKRIMRRLGKLEAMEVNFDDEDDSVYMQIDRYSQRLNKVYNKYCQLLKRSPYAGRLVNEKIRFVSSKHDEINRAITKSYRSNKFPSYYEVEKCVRKCVAKHNLGLNEAEILEESKLSFTKMGNLMQMRRKKELYEVHCGFIALNEDPANADEELKTKLQESYNEGEKKMKEVVDKYVKMQENNVSLELSEDSDDSNYKESDSEKEAS